MEKGVFIVIEGADGSGKETQFKLLRERLRAVGYEVETFDFPDYSKDSSYFVKQYLNGKYGKASSISPYAASIFYAIDRFEASANIKKALASGKVVLANRYVGSTMAHQGGKIADTIEQRSFFVWADSLEYQLLEIPRPNINLFLRVDPAVAQKLVGQKHERQYTAKRFDEHEEDIKHLEQTVETYEKLCQLFPKDYTLVNCMDGQKLLSIPAINNKIWSIIKPLLPAKPPKPPKSLVVNLGGAEDRPEQPKNITTSSGPLDFAAGDVSLATIFELSLNTNLELSYKFSWEKNGYDYLMPQGLPNKTSRKYEEIMETLTDLHKKMRDKLGKVADKDELLRPAMPLAALVRLRLKGDSAAIKTAIEHLIGLNATEPHGLAAKINAEAVKKWPNDFSQNIPAKPAQPEAVKDIIAKLVSEHLPQNLSQQTDPVDLVEVWPRNEFKILSEIMYPYSNLPRDQLEAEIDGWNYQQKYEALTAGLNNRLPLFADKVRYQFDITADRQVLNELAACGMVSEVKAQQPTPRYGYDVPRAIDAAGITDEYLDCFDKSLELFSTLQASGDENLAVYATLVGHKNRFELTCTLQALSSFKDASALLKPYLDQMFDKISGAHPIIGEFLKSGQAAATRPKRSRSRGGRRHSGKSKKS